MELAVDACVHSAICVIQVGAFGYFRRIQIIEHHTPTFRIRHPQVLVDAVRVCGRCVLQAQKVLTHTACPHTRLSPLSVLSKKQPIVYIATLWHQTVLVRVAPLVDIHIPHHIRNPQALPQVGRTESTSRVYEHKRRWTLLFEQRCTSRYDLSRRNLSSLNLVFKLDFNFRVGVQNLIVLPILFVKRIDFVVCNLQRTQSDVVV